MRRDAIRWRAIDQLTRPDLAGNGQLPARGQRNDLSGPGRRMLWAGIAVC